MPLTLLWARVKGRTLTQPMRLLFVVCAVSYAVWLSVFAIYRYMLTLEMLAPLLIALALSLWGLSERRRLGALVVVWVVVLMGTGWSAIGGSGGVRRDIYVDVVVPKIADPAHTLAVMAGIEPMGYIVPAFPPSIPFLRIDGWLDSPASHSAFGERMRTTYRCTRWRDLRRVHRTRARPRGGRIRRRWIGARATGLRHNPFEYRRAIAVVRIDA